MKIITINRAVVEQALEAIRIFREWEMGQDYHSNRETVLARAFAAEETLEAALAENKRDWSLLEATQESLREHMAEIQRLRAALAEPTWCEIHQHHKWCEHNGGKMGPTGWEAP